MPQMALPPGATLVDSGEMKLPPGAKLVTPAPADTWSNAIAEYGSKLDGAVRGLTAPVLHPIDTWHAITDALQHPENSANGQLAQKAIDAYKKGDTASAAVHALNWLVNGTGLGAGMDEAGEKFADGRYKEGLADTGAIATQVVAGAKGPQIVRRTGAVADAVQEAAPKVVPALRAGVKAAAPDVAMGTAEAAGSVVVADMLPGSDVAKYLIGAPTAADGMMRIRRGVVKGVKAGREAFTVPPRAAVVTAAAEPELATNNAGEPALQIPPGGLYRMPPQSLEYDGSYVRSVPGQYPATVAPDAAPGPTIARNNAGAPALQIPAGNTRPMPPVSMEYDPSFVRSVKGEYAPKAEPAAETPAAAVSDAEAKLLNDVSMAQLKKPFAKLTDPKDIENVRNVARAATEAEALRLRSQAAFEAAKAERPAAPVVSDAEALRQKSVAAFEAAKAARAQTTATADTPANGNGANGADRANGFKDAARALRMQNAQKMGRWLQENELGTSDAMDAMNDAHWQEVAKRSGVTLPKDSAKTIQAVKDLINMAKQ